METCWSTLAALLSVFCFIVPSNSIMPKPGNCPKSYNPIMPGKPCYSDRDCECEDKCCVFSYGVVCAPPVSTIPGCPINAYQMQECDQQCRTDSDCPIGEKCCTTGCGHLCMSTQPIKDGECPGFHYRYFCYNNCLQDNDCRNEQKCCPSNCGMSCTIPYLLK